MHGFLDKCRNGLILESLCFVREDPEEQTACLVEAYRLLRSSAYQLHLVMQQNLVVQDLVAFFSSCGVSG